MATIRIAPSAMAMDVNLDESELLSAFMSNLGQTIQSTVNASVHERMDNDIREEVREMVQKTEYLRHMRDWVMESLDRNDIAERVHLHLDYERLVDACFPDGELFKDPQFMDNLVRNRNFRLVLERYVNVWLFSVDGLRVIESMIETKTANMVNEVVERSMVVISQRLSGGSDV